jgi:hypothetical protein
MRNKYYRQVTGQRSTITEKTKQNTDKVDDCRKRLELKKCIHRVKQKI